MPTPLALREPSTIRVCLSCEHYPFCNRHNDVPPTGWCESHQPVSECGFRNRLGRTNLKREDVVERGETLEPPALLSAWKNAQSLIDQRACLACSRRGKCKVSEGPMSTCQRFEGMSLWGLRIRIGQESLPDGVWEMWRANLREVGPHYRPDGDAQKEAWRRASPQCAEKDSPEYQTWKDASDEGSLSMRSPQSPEYQFWLTRNPSSCPTDSKEHAKWRSQNASTQPKDSEQYKRWEKHLLAGKPCLKDPGHPDYKRWKAALLAGAPSAQNRESAEYKRWLQSLPSARDVDDPVYQAWDAARVAASPASQHETGHHESPKGKNRKGLARLYYTSSYERKFLLWVEADPTVQSFTWQPLEIPYLYEGRVRKYTPDALVFRDQEPLLYEVKPRSLSHVPEDVIKRMPAASQVFLHGIQEKRRAAEQWGQARGIRYSFWDPKVDG